MNSSYVPVVDTKVFETTWEDEADNGTIVTAANAAILSLAASDNYICVAASIDTIEKRENTYIRCMLYFGDTDVNAELEPPISEIDILCNKSSAAVSTDYKAWLVAKAFTAPEGVKNTQVISSSYRGHKRYVTLVNITDNVGSGFQSVVSKLADFSLTADLNYIMVNPTATTTVTLPEADTVLGKSFVFNTVDTDQIINLDPTATDSINDVAAGAVVNIGLGGEGASDNREWILTATSANGWTLSPMAEATPRETIETATSAAAYDVTTATEIVLGDSVGGNVTVNLPAATADLVGWSFKVVSINIDNEINLTIAAVPGTDTINGAAGPLSVGASGAVPVAAVRNSYIITCIAVGAWLVTGVVQAS